MPHIVIIDNFDSFTFTIAGYFQELGASVRVLPNYTSLDAIQNLDPDLLVIGPGPDSPSSAGVSKKAIETFAGSIPLLGICLGHQAINEVFGGKTIRAKKPMHGKTSRIFHNEDPLFTNTPQGFAATRYHSLVVDKEALHLDLEVLAETEEGEIMAISHSTTFLIGLQFHPEAYATDGGKQLLLNILNHLPVGGPIYG